MDVVHRLVDGHRADAVPAAVVERAGVREYASIRAARRARHADRSAARATATDPGERVARCRSRRSHVSPPIAGQFLNPEPDRIVDDAPLGYLSRDHLVGTTSDDDALPCSPHAVDDAVSVDASISVAPKDLPDASR